MRRTWLVVVVRRRCEVSLETVDGENGIQYMYVMYVRGRGNGIMINHHRLSHCLFGKEKGKAYTSGGQFSIMFQRLKITFFFCFINRIKPFTDLLLQVFALLFKRDRIYLGLISSKIRPPLMVLVLSILHF